MKMTNFPVSLFMQIAQRKHSSGLSKPLYQDGAPLWTRCGKEPSQQTRLLTEVLGQFLTSRFTEGRDDVWFPQLHRVGFDIAPNSAYSLGSDPEITVLPSPLVFKVVSCSQYICV